MEGWATIRYLHAQGKGLRAIAKELGVTRNTVRRAVRSAGPPHYVRGARPNEKLAPFLATIQTLFQEQHLIGSRILRELRQQGYTGGPTALYAHLRTLRAAPGHATLRYETPPGRQAQFDWSPYVVTLGGEARRVVVYGMILGYSRRKYYTASLDERQVSIFEAIEASYTHFGGAALELLVDNAKAFVLDARPRPFRWHPQFLALCGQYGVEPQACQVRRPQTKGKIEKPFQYLEHHFIKGHQWASFAAFGTDLARFVADDLDLQVHGTTRERPLDRFAAERPVLLPLPVQGFLRSLAEARHVSWDCLVSYGGSRYSVPATAAGQSVWVLPTQGSHLVIHNEHRAVLATHPLATQKGLTVIDPAHYATLPRRTPRTAVVLVEAFQRRFPEDATFLAGLQQQHPHTATAALRGILDLAELYDDRSLRRAFALAQDYGTYSHAFVRGLLESRAVPQAVDPLLVAPDGPSRPPAAVHTDLRVYQQFLTEVDA